LSIGIYYTSLGLYAAYKIVKDVGLSIASTPTNRVSDYTTYFCNSVSVRHEIANERTLQQDCFRDIPNELWGGAVVG